MRRALIAIGSNIDPDRHLPSAVSRLQEHPDIGVLAVSSIYESPAAERPDQPCFHNAAALVRTGLDPAALKTELRRLEAELGRVRSGDRHAARTIDLDIIDIEGFSGDVAGSVVPDPEVREAAHLAIPLAEIAPDWEYTGAGATLQQIADAVDATDQEIRKMTDQIVPMNKTPRYATESGMEEVIPEEVYDAAYEEHVRAQLTELGEDPSREGLQRTPLRVAKAMDFLTSGYTTTLEEVVNNAIFEADSDEMVLVKDVEFYSLCEHHMLPFFGKAHVAYLPNGKIVGLSKIARIVDLFARRLQVQERLTCQIAAALDDVLDPYGVGVVMEGSHFCMMMRGVQKQGSSMVTSAMRGGFKNNPTTRSEFMELIRQ
jgi:GTP cyclohydrolase I